VRIRTKLALITGAGAIAVVAVAVVGISALASVDHKTNELSQTTKILQNVATLRDNEGDMRVAVNQLAAALTPANVKTALSGVHDADTAMDQTVATLQTQFDATGNQTYLADFRDFHNNLLAWRQIRDRQIVPDAQAGNSKAALQVMFGPLSKADDAYAAPLDALTEALDKTVNPLTGSAHSTYGSSRTLIIVMLVIGELIAIALAFLIGRMVTRPLRKVSTVLAGLAEGDLTGVAAIDSRDEMGRMAQALDVATASIRSTVEALSTNSIALASAAEELSATNGEIAESAERTAGETSLLSEAADRINSNVSTVASGAEQMSASIRQIAENASEAATVAAEAVQSADAASASMVKLGESSELIGAVVKTITSIAEQTNLLALNATIEAARAGDAGKGFAVVAGEVKELAQETARATQDIGQRVETIRADTDEAVEVIGRIGAVIGRINDYTTTIAAAVEEQTATTNEMARSVAEAASSSGQIVGAIDGVASAAGVTSSSTESSRSATVELSRMAAELSSVVSKFSY